MTTAYEQLCGRFARLANLNGAAAVLHWDAAAMMPSGGAGARAEQLATLSLLAHEMLCQAELADLLDQAEGDSDGDVLGPWERANLREMRRKWSHATALPGDLVAALSRAGSACEMVWRRAREADDFASLAPHLGEVVQLVRQGAAAKGQAFGCAPYDALLSQYEPGLGAAEIDRHFDALAAFLPGLLGRVVASQPAPMPAPERISARLQETLSRRLLDALGFDFEHGRLDVSLHPFTGGVADDVRLTTRYDEADALGSLYPALHEGGHGMYERGLPPEWRRQPVGQAMGMAMHESQSLLVEMQVSRGDAFLQYLAALLQDVAGVSGPAWEVEGLVSRVRHVARSLIRVEADEVTYPLHIIHRYRLERAMLAGDLAVADLPGAWREGMKALLDIEVPNDRDGCMQDIHWMDGAFGYFPTYTLGAMAAAQLFQTAEQALPDLPADLARGDFSRLMAWLRETVHSQGRLHGSADDLLTAVTGVPLDGAIFRSHLEKRYLGAQGISQ
ncbi:MAG: carboxypeptidase M32 [Alphaproteobacteria bacterium]|jgi:carboxypeptidase Taq|nr:carboxypeptidase M32 [Alphaproteobacteria bacterium]